VNGYGRLRPAPRLAYVFHRLAILIIDLRHVHSERAGPGERELGSCLGIKAVRFDERWSYKEPNRVGCVRQYVPVLLKWRRARRIDRRIGATLPSVALRL